MNSNAIIQEEKIITQTQANSLFQVDEGRKRVSQTQREIFDYLKLEYRVNDIPINSSQTLHTVFVPCANHNPQHSQENYYIGHGFGGSSLMSFATIRPLLQTGNVIFWEVRGMGLNQKLQAYEQKQEELQSFFLESFDKLLEYYKHKNSTLICHSFSSYLALLYVTRNRCWTIHIKQLVLLSTIGITKKQQDWNNEIHSCSDILDTIINKIGWTFHLTYKSPLRTICRCCKKSLVLKSLEGSELNQKQQQLIYQIVNTLISQPDGSEGLFFRYFYPRALPKYPLEPLITESPKVKITLVYGGESDWVDKKGGFKIRERFPDKIKIVILDSCGHNIPFNTSECINLLEKIVAGNI